MMGIGLIPCLYFANTWLPSYFTHALGQDYDQVLANRLTVIYLMLDIGMWVGGALVLFMAKRHLSVLNARKSVILVAYILLMLATTVPLFDNILLTTVVLCAFVFGIGAFLCNQHAFKHDILPKYTGTVSGLVGFFETTVTFFVVKEVGRLTKADPTYETSFIMLGGFRHLCRPDGHLLHAQELARQERLGNRTEPLFTPPCHGRHSGGDGRSLARHLVAGRGTKHQTLGAFVEDKSTVAPAGTQGVFGRKDERL